MIHFMILSPKPWSFKTEYKKFQEMESKAFSKSTSIKKPGMFFVQQYLLGHKLNEYCHRYTMTDITDKLLNTVCNCTRANFIYDR